MLASNLLPPNTALSDVFFMRSGEDGAWRTIRTRYPRERILHIGHGIPKECVLPRYYHVDTYRMLFGASPKKTTARSPEASIRLATLHPALLKEKLYRAIDDAELVSFDIFDTLLIRTTIFPDEVFRLVEARAQKTGIAAEGFARARLQAQTLMSNPRLVDIYTAVKELMGIEADICKRLMQLELEVENNVVCAREAVREAFYYARAHHKRVFLLSDMYLPKDTLKQMLADNGITGYEQLVVSCEERLLKSEGLFELLVATGVSPKRIVHIGNSIEDDIYPAQERGFKTVLVPSPCDLARACGIDVNNLRSNAQAATSVVLEFANPFETRKISIAPTKSQEQKMARTDARQDSETPFENKTSVAVARFDESVPVELRRALLAWYPFPRGNRALFLGSDSEAFIELLSAQYATVDTAFDAQATYSCIVVLDPLVENNTLKILFDRLHRSLAPQGVLLVGSRNKWGIKYLVGGLDEVVCEPFSALDAHTASTCAPQTVLHGTKEMQTLLRDAGWNWVKTYSIMPDPSFAQAVYTDESNVQTGIRDRVLPFDSKRSPLVAQESDTYDSLVHEGLLSALASYHLYECSDNDPLEKQISSVALSFDRGPKRAFITTLYTDNTVSKQPATDKGIPALNNLYDNGEKLRKRGIPVVQQHLNGQVLDMPLIDAQSMLSYLEEAARNDDSTSVLSAFKTLYDDVLSSSEAGTVTDELLEQWGVREEELGPILSTGYIDMVPYNAFWVDGRPLYFDQEFTVENCPAAYVLFRAIHYAYIDIPTLEEFISVETLKRTFGLTQAWNSFAQAEEAFVNDVRNRSAYAKLLARTHHDDEDIRARRRVLMDTVTTGAQQSRTSDVESEPPYGVGLLMGVFDLFHIGHLRLIRRAKQRCRFLRVGVLSDKLVYEYKQIHPTIPQNQRMEIVGAIAEVDEVVLIEDNPSRIMEWDRRPFDCFFSGDDYAGNEYWMNEKRELEKRGSTIEFFPYTQEQSSTSIRRSFG